MHIRGLGEAILIIAGFAGVFTGHFDYAAAHFALAVWVRMDR